MASKKERQSKSYLIKGIWGGIIFALFATFVLPMLSFIGVFGVWLQEGTSLSVVTFLSGPIYYILGLEVSGGNIGFFVNYFFFLVSNLIFYAGIGALIGWIIDKIKSK